MIDTAAYVLLLLCSLLFPKEPRVLVDTWESNGRHECFILSQEAGGNIRGEAWENGSLQEFVLCRQTGEGKYEQRLNDQVKFDTDLDREIPEWQSMVDHASDGRAVESEYGPVRCIPTLGGYVVEFSYLRALVRPYSP